MKMNMYLDFSSLLFHEILSQSLLPPYSVSSIFFILSTIYTLIHIHVFPLDFFVVKQIWWSKKVILVLSFGERKTRMEFIIYSIYSFISVNELKANKEAAAAPKEREKKIKVKTRKNTEKKTTKEIIQGKF